MFTTIRNGKLGNTLDAATKNMKTRLKRAYQRQAETDPTRNNWEGVILQDGQPVRDVSWNGTVSDLTPLSSKEYKALDYTKGETGRCVHLNDKKKPFQNGQGGLTNLEPLIL